MKQVPMLESALSKVGSNNPMLKKFVYALGAQESGYNPSAVGPSTKSGDKAQGMLQVMPETFKGLQKKYPELLKSSKNPEDLAIAGVLYAQEALNFAKNDPSIAGAYFYGGPGGAQKALKGVAVSDPMNKGFPNTLQYGHKIAQRMNAAEGNWSATPGLMPPVVGTQVPQQVASAPAQVGNAPPINLYSTQVNNRLAELNKLLGAVPQEVQQAVAAQQPQQETVAAPQQSNYMNMFGFNKAPTVAELSKYGLI
jgi:hypothetical protein